jgi:hypothetical protein
VFALLFFSAQAACPATFVFSGAPSCVQLHFDGTRTHLDNACESAVLVDQSVATETSIVAAHTSVSLRDLNRFTLAVDGRLYSVVAQVVACPADAVAAR